MIKNKVLDINIYSYLTKITVHGGAMKRMQIEDNQPHIHKNSRRKENPIQCQSEQMAKENSFYNVDEESTSCRFQYRSNKKSHLSISKPSENSYPLSSVIQINSLQGISISKSIPNKNNTRKTSKLNILIKSKQPDGSFVCRHPYLHITRDEISRCIVSCTIDFQRNFTKNQ